MSAFSKRRKQLEEPECDACGGTNIIFDSRQGQTVCDDCGVIMEQSMISASTEYRNFSESDKPTGDPTRVAGGPLGTSIAAPAGDSGAYGLKMKTKMVGGGTEERFRAAFKMIGDTVVKMNLTPDVREAAQELYMIYAEQRDKVSDVKATAAACVFRACKDCKVQRTLKELNKVVSPEARMMKKIAKADRELLRVLQERAHEEARRQGIDTADMAAVHKLMSSQRTDEERSTYHPAHQIPRFGNDLGLTPRGIQVAKKISQAILPDDLGAVMDHKSWHGKQPMTLTAATLFIAMHLGSRVLLPGVPPRTLQNVAEICGVATATIEQTYAELYPELRTFIPATVKPPMTEIDWANFPVPDLRYMKGKA